MDRSVLNATYKGFIEIILQNNDTVVQTFHLDDYSFFVVGSDSGTYKIYRPTLGESIREMPLAELKDKYRKLSALEKARVGWEAEYEVSSKQAPLRTGCDIRNMAADLRNPY